MLERFPRARPTLVTWIDGMEIFVFDSAASGCHRLNGQLARIYEACEQGLGVHEFLEALCGSGLVERQGVAVVLLGLDMLSRANLLEHSHFCGPVRIALPPERLPQLDSFRL